MNYWESCIKEAFEESGIKASEKQIQNVAAWAEGAHENYSMANGYDNISNPLESEISRIKATHRAEMAKAEYREMRYKISVARSVNADPSDIWIENGDVMVKK